MHHNLLQLPLQPSPAAAAAPTSFLPPLLLSFTRSLLLRLVTQLMDRVNLGRRVTPCRALSTYPYSPIPEGCPAYGQRGVSHVNLSFSDTRRVPCTWATGSLSRDNTKPLHIHTPTRVLAPSATPLLLLLSCRYSCSGSCFLETFNPLPMTFSPLKSVGYMSSPITVII